MCVIVDEANNHIDMMILVAVLIAYRVSDIFGYPAFVYVEMVHLENLRYELESRIFVFLKRSAENVQ